MAKQSTNKTTTLSTIIDSDLKQAVNRLAKAKGMKVRSIVEYALREQLEDLMDTSLYQERLNDELVSMEEVKAYLKKIRKQ